MVATPATTGSAGRGQGRPGPQPVVAGVPTLTQYTDSLPAAKDSLVTTGQQTAPGPAAKSAPERPAPGPTQPCSFIRLSPIHHPTVRVASRCGARLRVGGH